VAAQPPEINPYSPPRERRASRRKQEATPRAPGERVKWIYAAMAGANALALLSIASGMGTAAGIQQELITLVDGPLRWALLVLAPVWIYYAWSGIPPEDRRGTTPGSAVVGLFIPFYSIFWIFAVNVRLCAAIDALLARSGDRRRAPAALAIVATVLYFVPVVMLLTSAGQYAYLALIADHALWVAYMLVCDDLRRAVLGVGPAPPPVETPAPTGERDEYDEKLDRELSRLDDG
jgi:hypothetical protein